MTTAIVDFSFEDDNLVSIATSKKFHNLNDLLLELKNINVFSIIENINTAKDLAKKAIDCDLTITASSDNYYTMEFLYTNDNQKFNYITLCFSDADNIYEITIE